MQVGQKARFIIFVASLGISLFLICLFASRPGETTCRRTEVSIKDSAVAQFISAKDIMRYLDDSGLNPYGYSYKNIDLRKMEKKLEKHLFVENAQCYTTPNGTLKVDIVQRHPVLRVYNGSYKDSYYIDSKGKRFPLSMSYAAYVPVVSGEVKITEDYVNKHLLEFANYVAKDKFWNVQIEQLYVLGNGIIEITPRVGEQVIVLGTTDEYKTKLKKLRTLYERAFSKVGWSKYSRIDLRFKGQVVCTKR